VWVFDIGIQYVMIRVTGTAISLDIHLFLCVGDCDVILNLSTWSERCLGD
jgi:hypothetical protein